MKRVQEDHYSQDYDYRVGSPHLKHHHLYESLMRRMTDEVSKVSPRNRPTVVEVGAGDGSITERLLALGCEVTGTDMSRDSISKMDSKFRFNDRFHGVHDPEGNLTVLGESRYDVIIYSSVLHHIPDYLRHLTLAIDHHLKPGGSLVSIQDPLWYSRVSKWSRRATGAAYMSWRLGQGELGRGMKTRVRRMVTGPSEEEPGDAVEYHVVRNGVDEDAISTMLNDRFDSVELRRYWSSQGTVQQKFGEKLGMVNTFAIFATGFDVESASA